MRKRAEFSRKNDLVGQRFGRLVVEREGSGSRWNCLCDCGGRNSVSSVDLRSGHTRSCGCLARELTSARSVRHGHAIGGKLTPEYTAWVNMLKRCNETSNISYHNYGARGIRVCERWAKFELFLEDMGLRPSSNHSLDRVDTNGNYEPSNCRWSSKHEQSRNRRNNRIVTWNGITKPLSDWAADLGIDRTTLGKRLDRWPIEDAMSRALRPDRRRHAETK